MCEPTESGTCASAGKPDSSEVGDESSDGSEDDEGEDGGEDGEGEDEDEGEDEGEEEEEVVEKKKEAGGGAWLLAHVCTVRVRVCWDLFVGAGCPLMFAVVDRLAGDPKSALVHNTIAGVAKKFKCNEAFLTFDWSALAGKGKGLKNGDKLVDGVDFPSHPPVPAVPSPMKPKQFMEVKSAEAQLCYRRAWYRRVMWTTGELGRMKLSEWGKKMLGTNEKSATEFQKEIALILARHDSLGPAV